MRLIYRHRPLFRATGWWQVLAIDVPFQNYEANPLIQAALSDQNMCTRISALKPISMPR